MEIGSAKTTLFNLGIKGIIGLTSEINNEEKAFFEGNTLDSTLLTRTDSNIAMVVNTVNRNAESLCRNKWQSSLDTSVQLICVNQDTIMRTLTASELAGKTLIVRDQDLTLSSYQDIYDAPINLFIDRGNLFLAATEVSVGVMPSFNAFGYLDDQSCEDCSRANYLK